MGVATRLAGGTGTGWAKEAVATGATRDGTGAGPVATLSEAGDGG